MCLSAAARRELRVYAVDRAKARCAVVAIIGRSVSRAIHIEGLEGVANLINFVTPRSMKLLTRLIPVGACLG